MMKHGEIAEFSALLAQEGWVGQGARELCHMLLLLLLPFREAETSAHSQKGGMATAPWAG